MWLEKKDKEQPSQQNTLDSNQSIGAGAGLAPTPQKSATPATGPQSSVVSVPKQSKQNFGTIQDYFKASKEQGERLGEQFTTKLIGREKQDIDEAAQQAKQDIATNTVNLNPDFVSKLSTDPGSIASNENDLTNFMKQWNASYKGPEQFESTSYYDKANKAAQQAKEKAAMVATTGGRQQFMQDAFGVYGQGNKGLDEALLQQSSYFPKTKEQEKEFGTVQDYLKARSSDVGEAVKAAKQKTDETRRQIQQAGQQAASTFTSGLQNRLKTAQQTSAADYNMLQNALQSGQPLPADVRKRLGLTEGEWNVLEQQIKNVEQSGRIPTVKKDIASFVRPDNLIGIEDVATEQDRLTDAAYNKLLGTSKLLSDKAGRGTTGPTYDLQGLRDYLKKNTPEAPLPTPTDAPKPPTSVPDIRTEPIRTVSDITGDILDTTKDIYTAPTDALKEIVTNPKEVIKDIGEVIKNPSDYLTNVGNKLTGTLDKITGSNKDNIPTLAPIEYANNDFEQTLKTAGGGTLYNKIPDQFKPKPGTDYTIPPKGAIPDVLRDTLITAYWISSLKNGWNPTDGVNKGISQEELYNAFKSHTGSLPQPMQDFVASYEKANPPHVPTTGDIMKMIEADKAQRRKDAEAGLPPTNVVSSMPITAPVEPKPQINPGVLAPKRNVMRAFWDGGLVEDDSPLKTYLKKGTR